MILTPAIIALMMGMLLAVTISVYSSLIGIRIIRNWDITSGSELQLSLERKTYLISTALAFVLGFELFSLFLFVYTADHIHGLFVGAMCAAGTLNVNEYGYSTLLLKIIIFVLCGLWLIVNHTDNMGPDYPLIKRKYKLLLLITALILVESVLEFRYFMDMEPNVITSCCGTLFSDAEAGVAAEMANFPPASAKALFFLSLGLTLRIGIYFLATGRGAKLFSSLNVWLLVFSIISVISFISLYFYELPTHHCPFCLLQREYYYIGYPLYLSLFSAAIAGMGAGIIERFKYIPSLRKAVPTLQRRLCFASLAGYLTFTAIALYPMLFSSFTLSG